MGLVIFFENSPIKFCAVLLKAGINTQQMLFYEHRFC